MIILIFFQALSTFYCAENRSLITVGKILIFVLISGIHKNGYNRWRRHQRFSKINPAGYYCLINLIWPVLLVSKLGPKASVTANPLFYLYFTYICNISGPTCSSMAILKLKFFLCCVKSHILCPPASGSDRRPLPSLTPPNVGPIWWWAWGRHTYSIIRRRQKHSWRLEPAFSTYYSL